MTSILALLAAVIFFKVGAWWLMAISLLVGLVQSITKHQMNVHVRLLVSEGWQPKDAAEDIPNGIASVNLFSSLVIFGLFSYGAYLRWFQ
jgi:hypothetical protein